MSQYVVWCDDGYFIVDAFGEIVSKHPRIGSPFMESVVSIKLPELNSSSFVLSQCLWETDGNYSWWDEDSGISNQFLWSGLVATIFLSIVAGIIVGAQL